MKFFGNPCKCRRLIGLCPNPILIILLWLSLVPLLADPPKVYLNKNTVLKGEPLELRIEIAGSDPEVSISKNIFSENGVTAEYLGVESNTTIVNMKVTQKKIIKFRILSSKSGSLTTPKIIFSVDQQPYTADAIAFTVKPEKFVPRPRQVDPLFDQFFSGNFPGFQEKSYVNPDEDDIKISFYTSRPRVYVGETVIASFSLYYRYLEKPNFERHEQEPLEFPFFTSEILPNVNVSFPPRATLNGQEYQIAPYNREVYALTPLRKGKYSLGAAKFSVEGNPLSYFSPILKESLKKTVEVLDLPSPKPKDFSGEVGDYKMKLSIDTKNVTVGSPVFFSVQISGEGTGVLFKDPLQSFCKDNSCKADITFVDESKTKKFAKLKNGEYGFESESIFKYSLYPKEKGKLSLGEISVVFFNPDTAQYETSSVSFPEIDAKEAPLFSPKSIPTLPSLNYKLWIFYFVVSGFIGFVFYLLRIEILNYAKTLIARIPLQTGGIHPDITKLDKAIGNKKGALLKVFLQGKGLNRTKVEELVRLKSNSGNLKLAEIYQRSDSHQKEIILNLIKEIIKENKLI
ncbi:MAG: BatD family protein [Leptospiraceae bacterium]|nr:BatD family protein [Leptospiraceae bacterium]